LQANRIYDEETLSAFSQNKAPAFFEAGAEISILGSLIAIAIAVTPIAIAVIGSGCSSDCRRADT